MYCSHVYFLKSQDYFKENNHDSSDWTLDYTIPLEGKYNNKKYDNACWNSVESPVALLGNDIYYLTYYNYDDGTWRGKIYKYKNIYSTPVFINSIEPYWKVGDDGRAIFGFGSIISYSNRLFVSEYDKIYQLDSHSKELDVVYSLSKSQLKEGVICSMYVEGTKLCCDLFQQNFSLEFKKRIYVDAESIVKNWVSSVKLNKSTAELIYEGQTVQLKATVDPSTHKVDSWASSDPSVATVNSKGLVTAVSSGTAKITAKAGKKKATCTVTVNLPKNPITSIRLSYSELSVRHGESTTINPIYSPSDADDIVNVVWKSSDTSICTVSKNGVVKALKPGKAVITVSNPSGKVSAKCNVTVTMRFDPLPLTLESKQGGISIKWNANSEAVKYRVYRKKKGESSWTSLGITAGDSYKDKNVEFGTTYYYAVRMLDKDGIYLCAYGSGTKINHSLSTPKITLKNVKSGVQITWSTYSDAVKYLVYVKDDGNKWTKLATVKKGNTYLDKTAIDGKIYSYTVVAVDSSSNNMNGKGNGVGIIRRYYVIKPKLNLSSSGIKISWDALNSAENYRVYRKDSSGSWKMIGKTSGLKYTDTAAIPNAKNEYAVRAFYSNDKALSEFGDGKSIYFAINPTKVSAQGETSGVRVSWKSVYSAERYRIYRKTKSSNWEKLGETSSLSYLDKSAKSGNNYYYSVIALDAGKKALNDYGEGILIKYRKPVNSTNDLEENMIDIGEGISIEDQIEEIPESVIEEESEEETSEETEEELSEENTSEETDEELSEENTSEEINEEISEEDTSEETNEELSEENTSEKEDTELSEENTSEDIPEELSETEETPEEMI